MIGYILSAITFVLGLIIGWQLDKNLSDRPFLRGEIYSPLYEEVRIMSKNISDFKNCYCRRYGRPDYSAPLPADKVPGNVRTSLIQTGKYGRVPQKLRTALDNYYDKCGSDWNPLLDIWNRFQDLKEGRITDIEVIDEGRGAIVKYSDGHRVKKSSLIGRKDYNKYEGIKELDEKQIMDKLRAIQQDLENLGDSLLKELQDKIRDPNPFKSFLPLGR